VQYAKKFKRHRSRHCGAHRRRAAVLVHSGVQRFVSHTIYIPSDALASDLHSGAKPECQRQSSSCGSNELDARTGERRAARTKGHPHVMVCVVARHKSNCGMPCVPCCVLHVSTKLSLKCCVSTRHDKPRTFPRSMPPCSNASSTSSTDPTFASSVGDGRACTSAQARMQAGSIWMQRATSAGGMQRSGARSSFLQGVQPARGTARKRFSSCLYSSPRPSKTRCQCPWSSASCYRCGCCRWMRSIPYALPPELCADLRI
jgi:hypothetical protein